MFQKVVVCGAGFLGSNIAKSLMHVTTGSHARRVQISSRNPEKVHASLRGQGVDTGLLPSVPVDITESSSLVPAFEGADVVISLVGIMHGTPKDFENVQWKGAENVARTAKNVGAKLIHFSAIGADPNSSIPYAKTKALAERSVFEICPDATIIRPSIVFGPGDSFFNRFAQLSRFLPFLPVFGGGQAQFQPVFVGDIARAVEIVSRDDASVRRAVAGKIIEAGGPDVFTYREIMQLVLRYTHRRRPIISLPFAVGKLQGLLLEQLPNNMFTITRAQVEQLKSDNVVSQSFAANQYSFRDLIQQNTSTPLKSVHDILPSYL